MSIGFFITGGIIFAIYMGLMIWNIVYSSKKQQEENYPNIDPDDPIKNPPNPDSKSID